MDQLAGLPIPASVLERDVLPARIPGYQPRLLDELGAMGEVAWVGRGSLGRDDGRVVLYRPGRELLRPGGLPDGVERPAAEIHDRIRAHLQRRGASFYRELSRRAGGGRIGRCSTRCGTSSGRERSRTTRSRRSARCAGSVRREGPPAATRPADLARAARGGRSLVAGEPARGRAPGRGAGGDATERIHALALALLERHGVVTREAVASEAIEGGFSAVYPVLRAMEEAGRIRRGYFVDGLGAAQFALPGAVDRLRSMRDLPGELACERGRAVQLLAAADPANPYGAALPWPRRGEADRRPFQRAAGAYVVLVDGAAVLYLDRGGTSMQTLPAADDPESRGRGAAAPCATWSSTGGCASSSSRRSTASPCRRRRSATRCSAPGSSPGYRGYALRSSPAAATDRAWARPSAVRCRALADARGRHAGPDRRGAPPVPRRPRGDGGEGAAPGPQVERLVGATVTGVEAAGKNLLIRFDNGLEVRTHLRMRGSWHRYRPGERVAPAAGSRARLVLEVPGAVAVCFDAPVGRAVRAAHGGAAPRALEARARPAGRPGRRRRGAPPAARPRRAPG